MPLDINIEKPGSYFEFSFSSARGGFAPIPQTAPLMGVMSSAGTATANDVVQVLSPEHGDTLFGTGSELALMCRAAFAVGSLIGSMPLLYAVPIAAPSGGGALATVTTIEIAGTPTVADTLVVRIAGRTLRISVGPTSTADTIAADLEATIDGRDLVMPITAGVATDTVTCTHRTAGVNGNEVVFEATRVPAGLTVTITQTVAGVGESDIEPALDALAAQDWFGGAVPNNTSGDVTDVETFLTSQWASGTKHWQRVWFGENGSLADAQSLAIDNFRLSFAALRNARSLPCEIAAALTALDYSKPEPNFNYDDFLLPLYGGELSDAWTNAEIEALLDAGVSPLQPTEREDRVRVVKLVTGATTLSSAGGGSAPSFVLRDIAVPKTGAFVARQIDAEYGNRRPQTLEAIRDLMLAVDRRAEEAGFIRNVETLKAGITVVQDPDVASRALAKNPIEVVSPLHQAVFSIEVQV